MNLTDLVSLAIPATFLLIVSFSLIVVGRVGHIGGLKSAAQSISENMKTTDFDQHNDEVRELLTSVHIRPDHMSPRDWRILRTFHSRICTPHIEKESEMQRSRATPLISKIPAGSRADPVPH